MIFIDYPELSQIVHNCLVLSTNVMKMDAIWGAHVLCIVELIGRLKE
jgi:hypothetical protein